MALEARGVGCLIAFVALGCSKPAAGPVIEPLPPDTPTPAEADALEYQADADVDPDADETEPEPEPEPDPESPEPELADAPPLRPGSSLVPPGAGQPEKKQSEAYCAGVSAKVDYELQRAQGPCESADDCELVDLACPFGCYGIVSKLRDRRRLRKSVASFFESCPLCKNKCSQPPSVLACVHDRCVESPT